VGRYLSKISPLAAICPRYLREPLSVQDISVGRYEWGPNVQDIPDA